MGEAWSGWQVKAVRTHSEFPAQWTRTPEERAGGLSST